MTTNILNPSFLSAFHLNLPVPELGPMIPFTLDAQTSVLSGALFPCADRFLPVAAEMYREAQSLRAERRPAPIPKGSLIRRLWEKPGLAGYKKTISGLPREVGPDPEDARLRWIVSDAGRYAGGIESFIALQKGEDSQLKEVRVRRDRKAVHVEVTYGTYGFQVTHSATVGRGGRGDFQGLCFQIVHEALDGLAPRLLNAAAAMPESALAVFVDDLCDERFRPIFEIYYHPTSSLGPARLNASFARASDGSAFPDKFISFLRRIEDEIRGQIRRDGGRSAPRASRELINGLLPEIISVQSGDIP